MFYMMWEALISSGKQATRLTHRVRPVTSTHTPLATRAFGAGPHYQKQRTQPEDIDREALDPQRNEVTQSGTDSEIAQHDAAWDPSNTAPESEMEATEQEHSNKGTEGTLNMSPANQSIRAWQNQLERDPEPNVSEQSTSRKGTAK